MPPACPASGWKMDPEKFLTTCWLCHGSKAVDAGSDLGLCPGCVEILRSPHHTNQMPDVYLATLTEAVENAWAMIPESYG